MKQIEKTSLGLLLTSILIAVAVLSIYGIGKYMDKPSLLIPPADSKSRTTLNMVLEAKNLEGLKKVCALWASQDDRKGIELKALVNETQRIKRDNFIFILAISFVFIIGSANMYLQVRKIKKELRNAL